MQTPLARVTNCCASFFFWLDNTIHERENYDLSCLKSRSTIQLCRHALQRLILLRQQNLISLVANITSMHPESLHQMGSHWIQPASWKNGLQHRNCQPTCQKINTPHPAECGHLPEAQHWKPEQKRWLHHLCISPAFKKQNLGI